tara:strand:+ start:327 stop:503 length:177 start_codon:yes stop_codon:yes gene_type:complete
MSNFYLNKKEIKTIFRALQEYEEALINMSEDQAMDTRKKYFSSEEAFTKIYKKLERGL